MAIASHSGFPVGVTLVEEVKVNRNFGMLALSAWLVLYGLNSLLDLHFSGLSMVMGILALVAGVLILVKK